MLSGSLTWQQVITLAAAIAFPFAMGYIAAYYGYYLAGRKDHED